MSALPDNTMSAALNELEPNELTNLVKQEAFNSVPDDIAAALRQSPDLWYQTIIGILTDINEQISRRKALALATKMSPEESREYNSWRAKALSVKSRLEIRVIEARTLRKKANVKESARLRSGNFRLLRDAVVAHRDALQEGGYEPTEHDLVLWQALAEIDAGLHDTPTERPSFEPEIP